MAVIGLDLGGTKISSGFVSGEGGIRCYNKILFHGATGNKVFEVLKERIRMVCGEVEDTGDKVTSDGISVPGIYYKTTGHVWAPNIPGWDDFPLMEKLQESFGEIRFFIDNDRACYILGEVWKGKAQGCRDVIFIAVGTGLAAGMTLTRLGLSQVLKKKTPWKVVFVSLCMVTGGIALLEFSRMFYVALAGVGIIGVGLAASFPVMLSYTAGFFPNNSGTSFSIVIGIALLGNTLLNVFTGYILNTYGIGKLNILLFAFIVVMLILLRIINTRLIQKQKVC